MTGRVWLARVEFDRRDLRVGVAWSADAQGWHLYVCLLVRLHLLRTGVQEMAPAAHKLTLPPEPIPPKPIQAGSKIWRRR